MLNKVKEILDEYTGKYFTKKHAQEVAEKILVLFNVTDKAAVLDSIAATVPTRDGSHVVVSTVPQKKKPDHKVVISNPEPEI